MTLIPVPPVDLPDDIVKRLTDAVLGAARHGLTARRFLDFERPLGAGVTSISVGSTHEREIVDAAPAVRIVAERTIPVPSLYVKFRVPVRAILGARDQSLPLNTRPAEDAGQNLALAEERLIYHGDAQLGLVGLLNAPGTHRVALGDWAAPGQAIQDVIRSADQLDASNARAPFALVLAPHLYNMLFRKYDGSDVIQIDHLRRLAAGGVYKSLAIETGGVLVSTDVGPLVCAQDLEVHYLAPSDASLIFEATEAIVLRLDEAKAACVLVQEEKRTTRSKRT